jgi:hypothetical protein
MVDVVVFGIILDTHWMVGLEVIFSYLNSFSTMFCN